MGGLHVHFDAVGGVAGDMIVAALLDARPDLRDRVWADLAAVLPPESGAPRLLSGAAAGLRAVRFQLEHDEISSDQLALPSALSREREKAAGGRGPKEGLRRDSIESPPVPGAGRHGGAAGDYRDMRARIARARLSEGAADRALAILALIAGVEAELHGVPVEEVHFHEIADWDSLADVVAIGSIAAALGEASYSVSDLPRGGGLVKTRHGLLPVPAPATVALLKGFTWRDDGIGGERVTPTGAAALAHLVGPSPAAFPRGKLVAIGAGAGMREIEGLPNVLRALVLDRESARDASPREVAVISFDVDDMTGEEIAASADRLRAAPGALDLTIGTRLGKKGRPVHDFRLLARTEAVEAIAARCLTETSTLGLRWRVESREVLPRDESVAPNSGRRRPRQARGQARWGDQRQGRGRRCPRGEFDSPPPPQPPRRVPERSNGAAFAMMRDDAMAGIVQRPVERVLSDLENLLREAGPIAVAVSGGVDSMTLATIAHRAAPGETEMIHAASAAVPAEATKRVKREAARMGWRLAIVDAAELADPRYRSNPVDRCFFCKTNLYDTIAARTEAQIVSGANMDDLGEYRPGLDAARRHGVRHPFLEVKAGKALVRALARHLGLKELAELPAAPCLSSRVETGIAIRPDLLAAIHAGERLLVEALPRIGPQTAVRCRVRRSAVVIELDPGSFEALGGRSDLVDRIALLFAAAGVTLPVAFAPYRTGSAFLRGPTLPTLGEHAARSATNGGFCSPAAEAQP